MESPAGAVRAPKWPTAAGQAEFIQTYQDYCGPTMGGRAPAEMAAFHPEERQAGTGSRSPNIRGVYRQLMYTEISDRVRVKKPQMKTPKFKNESEEADWWYANRHK